MRIDIITIFPSMFVGPFDTSMLKKAKDMGAVEIYIHDLRKWSTDKHKTVDDRPFGGGKGMVLKVEPIYEAIEELISKFEIQNSKQILKSKSQKVKTILLSPTGVTYNQSKALELSGYEHLIFICGHYEGVDQRVADNLVDESISIGDYVMTGGEIPTMAIVDSVVRLLPGVLEDEAKQKESFARPTTHNSPITVLDYPVYTRPSEFNGWKVPEVLQNGNHKEIEGWRHSEAHRLTKKFRPDLIRE